MTISPLQFRQAVAPKVGDWFPLVTTADGLLNGSSFICSQFIGYGTDFSQGWWALCTSGSNGGATPLYREVSSFDTDTGEFTVSPPFTNRVLTTVTMELHQHRPDLFPRAGNTALRLEWPYLHNPTMDTTLKAPPFMTGTIATSSNASPAVITMTAEHGLSTGQTVTIAGHTVAALNGTWIVTVLSTTTFSVGVAGAGGTGGTVTASPNLMKLPSTITRQELTSIQAAGDVAGAFANIPSRILGDVTFSPDGTLLYIGRKSSGLRGAPPSAGTQIYLFCRKFLTLLTEGATFGQLTADTTGTTELTDTRPEWELWLAASAVALLKEEARRFGDERRGEWKALQDAAAADVAMLEQRVALEDIELQDLTAWSGG
jgi:hypothetical protein